MTAKLIACRMMFDELRALMPPDTEFEPLEIGLHNRPRRLHAALAEAVAAADGHYDPIYLGYGLCSTATVDLVAHKSRLVLFRADDCIGVFLGSRQERLRQLQSDPGCYFLTRGYIGDGTGTVFDEYNRMEKKYGPEQAMDLMQEMLAHYTKLVFLIVPGQEPTEAERAYARDNAERFGLAYVEMQGTLELLRQMAKGTRSSNIAVFAPGEPVSLNAMLEAGTDNPDDNGALAPTCLL